MTAVNLMATGMVPAQAERLARRTMFIPAGIGKAGATAGWTTANDTGDARCPASQTASTFTLPVLGLHLGDVVKSFKVIGQVESAGNTATLDADLRKLTNAAADPSDASIGAITQVSATADTAVTSEKDVTDETVASGEQLYVLLTATTAASTDIRVLGVEIEVDRFGVTA